MSYSFDGGVFMPIMIPAEDNVTVVTPPSIYLPLAENSRVLVNEGDHVYVGDCVIKSEDHLTPPMYSGVSGTVKGEVVCKLRNTEETRALHIESDLKTEYSPRCMSWPKRLSLTGRDELILLFKTASLYDPLTESYLADSVKKIGRDTDLLIVSCVNADPTLQVNHALLCSYAQQLVEGSKVIAQALHCSRILFAVAYDDYCLHFLLHQAIGNATYCSVEKMKMKYPQGRPQLLKKQLAKDSVALVVGAEVCVHTYFAFAKGYPMTSRVISVQKGKSSYVTCEVPIGSRMDDVISYLFIKSPTKFYWNGGFVGEKISDDQYLIDQNLTSVHWYSHSRNEQILHKEDSCIHCGHCADVCPGRLLPGRIFEAFQEGNSSYLEKVDFQQCMACGSCTYVCPEHLPVMNTVKEARASFDTIVPPAERGMAHG